jgi:phosphoribosylformimino-5-aminoimidazole carboxamide ribotide isomerase
VQVIPSIDLQGGRSRVVFWPGVSAGVGAPTDRPERIAEHFAGLGAPVIHLVDFDGARAGAPGALDEIGAVASRVAVPLQVAGGLEDPDAIRLVFAAGATRVVLGLLIADDPGRLRECVAVAGDWLGVGLDLRPDRLAAFPWRRPQPPTLAGLLDELLGAGVRRFVISHGGTDPELDSIARLARDVDAELLLAGGPRDLAGVGRLRETGATGIILGEALLSGAIDSQAARALLS